MDLGFGVVLDKFEEYFGRRVTRLMLMLIGVAIVAGCVGLIWTVLAAPFLAFLDTPIWGQKLLSVAIKALAIGMGVSVGLGLSANLARWRRVRALKKESDELIAATREVLEDSTSKIQSIEEINLESRRLMELAMLMLEGAVEAGHYSSEESQVVLARIASGREMLRKAFDEE